MGRFDFQSPGAAASAQIQDFIKQRNTDERAALLDALDRQNMEHGWKIQDSNLELAKTQEKRLQTGADRDWLETQAGYVPEEAEIGGLSPELQQLFRSTGATKQVRPPTPRVDTTTDYGLGGDVEQDAPTVGVEAPSREVYAGGDKFRAEQRGRWYADEFLAGNPDLATEHPEMLQAVLAQRAGLNLPAGLFAPKPSVQFITPEGKKGGFFQGQRGTEFMEGNYHPSTYYSGGSGGSHQYVGTDPASGLPIVMDRAGRMRVATIEGAEGIGPKPGAPRSPTAGMLNSLATARREFEELNSRFQAPSWITLPGSKTKSAQLVAAEAAYDQALGAVLAATGASPGIQDLAKQIGKDPEDSKKTVEQLIQEGAIPAEDISSPQEIAELNRLLNYIRGAAFTQ